jgi:hypothetical protein
MIPLRPLMARVELELLLRSEAGPALVALRERVRAERELAERTRANTERLMRKYRVVP